MEPLDGNAIAGPLAEHFGDDMTRAVGACGHCGSIAAIGELCVYTRAPGSVVRCRVCGNVVIVVIERGDRVRVELTAFSLRATA